MKKVNLLLILLIFTLCSCSGFSPQKMTGSQNENFEAQYQMVKMGLEFAENIAHEEKNLENQKVKFLDQNNNPNKNTVILNKMNPSITSNQENTSIVWTDPTYAQYCFADSNGMKVNFPCYKNANSCEKRLAVWKNAPGLDAQMCLKII
jgi:hypothetical protein